jgi:hypothetical protein
MADRRTCEMGKTLMPLMKSSNHSNHSNHSNQRCPYYNQHIHSDRPRALKTPRYKKVHRNCVIQYGMHLSNLACTTYTHTDMLYNTFKVRKLPHYLHLKIECNFQLSHFSWRTYAEGDIWGFHSSNYGEYYQVGYGTMQSDRSIQPFQRNVLLLFQGQRVRQTSRLLLAQHWP